MNKILKLKSILILLALSVFTYSCSSDSNDDIVPTEGEEFDAEIIVTESGVGDKRNVMVTGGDMGELIKTRVTFSNLTNSMKKLYVTQNVGGFGEEAYDLNLTQQVDTKADGSLDLSGANSDTFDFKFDLIAPSSVDNGTIVYKFWATTGRGDFRDVTKRNAFDGDVVATITIEYGTGTNAASGMKTYETTILAAPLGDGSSDTFMSVFDGQKYKISEGEEFAALWDFGYYYLNSTGASLASTADYPKLFDDDNDPDTPLVAVSILTRVAQEELNDFYIGTSTLDFDTITSASDLDGISRPADQDINNLSVDDVIEFEDRYGNKGVMKVINIVPGFGSDASITLSIKVQS